MNTFDGVSQISPLDAEQMQKMNPAVNSDVLFPGVDLEYFQKGSFKHRDRRTIMHVGTLDPVTKLPAMMWFVNKVLPKVQKKYPDVVLEIVGQIPKCDLHNLNNNVIKIRGVVSDVRPFLQRATAFIAPQFVGSGVRIKILNAMAAGNAVVSTTVACEGLPVTDGEDILIADDEAEFAEHVCRLLSDSQFREKIGNNARIMIEERFSWHVSARQLEKNLLKAIKDCK